MFSKFLKKANIHGGGAVTFLIAVFVTILFANSTAFAKIDNGAYLLAATTNNSSNNTKPDNKTTNKPADTSKKPKTAEEHNNQGNIYYNQQKYNDAIKEYNNAINMDKDNPTYYTSRGFAHSSLKDYSAADKDFNLAISKDKSYARAYRGRALNYKAQDKKKEALTNFLTAGKKAFDKNENIDAISNYEEALKIDGRCAEATFYLGWIDYKLGNYQSAIKKLDETIKFDSHYKPDETYNHRGWANYMLNFDKEALDDFTESINKNPNLIDSYRWRGATYYRSNNFLKAILDFKEVLYLDETQKTLNDSEKQDFQKKIDTCWNALNPLEKLTVIVRYPELIGEIDGLFKTFLITIAINFVLALAYKFKTHTLTVGSAVQEFLLVTILLVIVLSLDAVDDKLPFDLQEIILILFVAFTLLSILENAGHLGVPIPAWLTNLLQNIINMIKRFFRLP